MEELLYSIKKVTTLITKFEFVLALLNREIIELLKDNYDVINFAYNAEELEALRCFSINYPVVRFELYKITLEIQISDILSVTEVPCSISNDEIKLGVLRELFFLLKRI